jgi:hypothetical protein
LQPQLADLSSVVSRVEEEVADEPCTAENDEPPNTPATPASHVEWVHQDVMLSLEHKHEVECAREI